jgi:hypothetical protein
MGRSHRTSVYVRLSGGFRGYVVPRVRSQCGRHGALTGANQPSEWISEELVRVSAEELGRGMQRPGHC